MGYTILHLFILTYCAFVGAQFEFDFTVSGTEDSTISDAEQKILDSAAENNLDATFTDTDTTETGDSVINVIIRPNDPFAPDPGFSTNEDFTFGGLPDFNVEETFDDDVVGDPHIYSMLPHFHHHPICYDLTGDDKRIIEYLYNNDVEASVLFEFHRAKKQKTGQTLYVGQIMINSPKGNVHVTRTGITVLGRRYNWRYFTNNELKFPEKGISVKPKQAAVISVQILKGKKRLRMNIRKSLHGLSFSIKSTKNIGGLKGAVDQKLTPRDPTSKDNFIVDGNKAEVKVRGGELIVHLATRDLKKCWLIKGFPGILFTPEEYKKFFRN